MARVLVQSFRAAVQLGWKVETNWTDPLLFFALSILKPIASVMIIVFMYRAIAEVGATSPMYAYVYFGNIFYIYVGAIMAGASYSILEDREHYQMLKYLYIAPMSMPMYLVGRAVVRFLVATIGVLITSIAGVTVFNINVHLSLIDWPLLGLALILGFVCILCLGICLGMWTLLLRSEPWFASDAVTAGLYLLSGAVFPITLLPALLQPVAYALPLSYWLELMRRAVLGPSMQSVPSSLTAYTDGELLRILLTLTLALVLLATLAYRYFDRLARERGMIDVQSNF